VLENTAAIDLAVGRSSVRQRILSLLMAEPGLRLHLREIQRRAVTSPGTASRELARLVAAGLIEREAEGNQVYFRASSSPFATMLRSVLVAMPAQTFAPRPRRLPRVATPKPGAELLTAGAVDRRAPADVDEQASTQPPQNTPAAVSNEADSVAPFVAVTPPGTTAAAPATTAPATASPDSERQPAMTPRLGRLAATKPNVNPDPVAVQIATRMAKSMREMYGESVQGVYLYGARAAGTGQADADVETIVVLDRVEHYGAELERTSHLCSELSHEMNVVVSRIFVADADWNGGGGAAEAIRAEAVAV
jgi:DNA-binding transcriptional ArsR family regulator